MEDRSSSDGTSDEASVAQWLARAPFTSESWVRFSIRTLRISHVKRVCQRSAESRGFSPGTPVSSHRESWRVG